ncbi:MAG: dTMP kinase [Lentisphaeria bacterium]|nr:dTMP kinase [Lentisphaeria bacterium]
MEKKENNGFFISLEGGEGCGKSTQLPLLADALRKKFPGREIIATRSPGGTNAAEKIRAVLKEKIEEEIIPQTELLLFGACHAQMVHNLIRPAMERGAILITDRFFDSTIVYQGYARGLDQDMICTINDFSCGGTKPDLTLLLDLSTEQGAARTHARAAVENDRFDSETDSFHKKIRAGFLALAAAEPERFAVIDATGPIEDVHNAIMEVINERLA